MTGATGSRAARFVTALAVLAVAALGAPLALLTAARSRFGGGSPFAGVADPRAWRWEPIRRALTEQLTEDTIADVVIRAALVVAWVAVAVFVLNVVAEAAHMVRHGGLPMPHVRGLGWSQSGARAVAAGLLVVMPMLTSPGRVIARDGFLLEPASVSAAGAHGDVPDPAPPRSAGAASDSGVQATADEPASVTGSTTYVVRAGDSVYAIAERLAGPDVQAVHACAEQILELNLGRTMADGQRFDNAAFIDVGWEIELPAGPVAASTKVGATVAPRGAEHVVARGETLWSIADDELGDAERWPEIFELNEGRSFDDGRSFRDPSLIHPGWDLDLPTDGGERPAPPDASPVDLETVADVDAPSDVVSDAPVDAPVEVADEAPTTTGAVTTSTVAGEPALDTARSVARPTNRWVDVAAYDGAAVRSANAPDDAADESEPRLLTFGRAAMLSAGVLTLLAVRRRRRLRRARARARLADPGEAVARTERTLRSIDPGDRISRLDLAVRAAARPLVAAGARVVAVTIADDGELELHTSGPVRLDPPWERTPDPARWRLAASVPTELIARSAEGVAAPCPTLVQLGRTTDAQELYVDLEALEALEVGGPGDQADAIVSAVAATLAGSGFAEVTTLVSAGVDDAAFFGHRHHVPARDVADAFDRATAAVGCTATIGRSTFELRTQATGGETWEPAVVLIGAAVGTVTPPADRTGVAVVSASPIHGPSSRLAPDEDAWVLRPLGVRCLPVGLTAGDVAALSSLVRSADAALVDDDAPPTRSGAPVGADAACGAPVSLDDDVTLAPVPDAPTHDIAVGQRSGAMPATDAEPADRPPLLVRLLGPVSVCAADGRTAAFEKSKATELVAWLATHRERSTRRGARTAMWELDVRDATFANVVSDARRSLARLVEPPDGEEWIARTLTEALPLHPRIRSDADLVREALERARQQTPEEAIATLRRAAELVVGVPFEGTGYLWPDAEGIASQLVLLATSVTSELAAHCLSTGDVDGVFEATGRGLQVLPGHERLIALRMRAHARAGDHAGVRHEWEQYERVVSADPWSDGEPAPELVELRRELLAR